MLWFTGLSGAGKSTLANAVARALRRDGRKLEVLDGDAVRQHLSRGLGFSMDDRKENILRIAYVAHLLARNGVFVVVAAISPFRESREIARAMIERFVEAYVAPPLQECIKRDVKGLYAQAMSGQLREFTGISQPYEEPVSPELRIDTSRLSIDESVSLVLSKLRELGHL